MVDEAAAFTILRCVHGYRVYQHMWTPFIGEIATTVRDPGNASDCYAEYTLLTVLPLHSVCNFSNSTSFSNFVLKFMQTLFLI